MEDQAAPPDSAVIEAALAAMLAQHPNALVAAIDDAGLFIPIPSGVELGQHRVSALVPDSTSSSLPIARR